MDSLESNNKKNEQKLRRTIFVLVLGVVLLSIFWGFELKMNYEGKLQAATAQSNMYVALMAFETSIAQNIAAQEQIKVALSRQIAANAQLLLRTDNTQRMTALLLSIESMRLSPSGEAAQIMWSAIESPVLQINHRGVAVFSPTGDLIVSVGRAGDTIRVLRAFTGEEITRISLMKRASEFAISPNGRYVASNGFDETEQVWITQIWEMYTGKEVFRKVHRGYVTTLAFSPNSNFMVSAECEQKDKDFRCAKKAIRIWDVATGEDITRITYDVVYENTHPLLSFSPDGLSVISTTCDRLETMGRCVQSSIHIWEAATGKEITRISQIGGEFFAKFSNNGKYILSGNTVGELRVWDVSSGREVFRKIDSGDLSEVGVAISQDERYLAGGRNIMRVWEIETGEEILETPFSSGNRFVTFSPDGKFLAFEGNASYPTHVVQIWEISTGKEVYRRVFDTDISSVSFSPDGRHLLISGEEIKVLEIFPGQHGIPGVYLPPYTFSPDGHHAIKIDGLTLIVSEILTGNAIAQVRLANENFEMEQISLSADGRYLAQGSKDGHLSVWDTTTGVEIFYQEYNGKWVTPLSFTADGRYLALAVGSTVYVWDVINGREISLMVNNAPMFSAAFSPDGKYLISGGDDLTAHIWDPFTGIEIAHYYQGSRVQSVAFSPDGKYAAFTGGSSVLVWDVINGKEIKRIASYAAKVFFSSDGKYMLLGEYNNPALIINDGYRERPFISSSVWSVGTWQEISRIPHRYNMLPLAFNRGNDYVIFGGDGMIQGWEWRPDDLIDNACFGATRNLTPAEWNQYIGTNLPYQAVCPNLPLEGQATPFPVTTPTLIPTDTLIPTSTPTAIPTSTSVP